MQPPTHPPEDNVKAYLDYLDKEMTIMGILSTFCIVTLGFVAEKLLFLKKTACTNSGKMKPYFALLV